jgi:hypothetical protein
MVITSMISTVVVLCLFINGELKEHRKQDDLSTCLKHKRVAERNMPMDNKRFSCGTVEAELQKNPDGSYSIKKLITDEPDK